jgi:hypothetical protein
VTEADKAYLDELVAAGLAATLAGAVSYVCELARDFRARRSEVQGREERRSIIASEANATPDLDDNSLSASVLPVVRFHPHLVAHDKLDIIHILAVACRALPAVFRSVAQIPHP